MNLCEYNKIKNLSYLEYCNYLKKKYGKATDDYMTASYNKKAKISRTKEGLYCHHIKEDEAIMLSTKEYAIKHPFEWQKADNLVYCDLLEHMLLHILICEEHMPKTEEDLMLLVSKLEVVGIGGILNFFIPELNDYYSGWRASQAWQQNCQKHLIGNKDVYLALIKRTKQLNNYPCYREEKLYSSFGFLAGWDKAKNEPLYEELRRL